MREFILYGQGNDVVRVTNGEVFTKDTNRKIGTLRDGVVYGLDGRFIRRISRQGAVVSDEAPDMASTPILAAG
jgi:hypothetical protein